MSIDPDAELAQFQQFIADRREKGHCLSPEEALGHIAGLEEVLVRLRQAVG